MPETATKSKSPKKKAKSPGPGLGGGDAKGVSAAGGLSSALLGAQEQGGNGLVASMVEGSAAQDEDSAAAAALGWTKDQLVKVRAALQAFAKEDPKEVGKVIGTWYKSKAYADSSDPDSDGGEMGGGAGAWGGARGGHVDLGTLGDAWEVLAEVGLVAGGQFSLSKNVEKQLGAVAVRAGAGIKAFAGVYVKAQAAGYVTKGNHWYEFGVYADASGRAFAGAEGKGHVEVEFDVGNFGLEGGVEGQALAGAEAEGEGHVAFNPRNLEIELSGKVGAFAGVKVSGKVKAKGKLYGRDAASFEATGEAAAGSGAGIGGGFTLRRGVLKLNLGTKAVLGVGGGVEGATTVDFKPIAVWVNRNMAQQGWQMSSQFSKDLALREYASPRSRLRRKLREYRDFKLKQLRMNRADNFVKREKVQAFIDDAIPRHDLKKAKKTDHDDAIRQLVLDELTPDERGARLHVVVQYGYVTELELLPKKTALAKLKGAGNDLYGNDNRGAAVTGMSDKASSKTDLRGIGA